MTSPERTLMDQASVLDFPDLRRSFNEADRKRLIHKRALMTCLQHGRGRKGFRKFKSLVEIRHPEIALTRSDLEVDFDALCQRHGFDRPLINSTVNGEEVDFYWPASGLIIETDGYEFHQGRMNRDRDIRKDNKMKRAGFQVHRFTGRMVSHEIPEIVELLRLSLDHPTEQIS